MNDEHCESTQEKKEFFGREDKLKEIEQAFTVSLVWDRLRWQGNMPDVTTVAMWSLFPIARQWQRQLLGHWRTLSETISAKEMKKRLLRSMRIL